MKALIGPILMTLLMLAGGATLLSKSTEAREVVGEGVWNLFGFFTTPFVLETSIALFGIVAVVTYNQWRLNKDGNEWVEMEVPQAPAAKDQQDS